MGIVPPDRSRDVIVQPSSGCPWNRCTYCRFYRGQTYQVPTCEKFQYHVREVRAFFGRALPLRWGVFLGEANALALSQNRLLHSLEVVREEFPDHDNVAAFLDPHHAPVRSREEFAELRSHGLTMVAVGFETGSQELLDLLGKEGRVETAVEAVRTARAGGLRVNVMVLVGPGNYRIANRHVRETVDAIVEMGLSDHDIIYLSPLRINEGQTFPFPVLPKQETEAMGHLLRRTLERVSSAKVTTYPIGRIHYFA